MEQERKQLGDAELEIMQVIWQTEGAVSQVGPGIAAADRGSFLRIWNKAFGSQLMPMDRFF